METLHFTFPPGRQTLSGKAHVGVVASGNLEVLMEPPTAEGSTVRVRTSVTGFEDQWLSIFRTFFERHDVTAAIEINDGGASPPTVQLRLEQALEESRQ
jgi:malonate decarboxylase delta subunit